MLFALVWLTCRLVSHRVQRIDSDDVRRWLEIGQTAGSRRCCWCKRWKSDILRLATDGRAENWRKKIRKTASLRCKRSVFKGSNEIRRAFFQIALFLLGSKSNERQNIKIGKIDEQRCQRQTSESLWTRFIVKSFVSFARSARTFDFVKSCSSNLIVCAAVREQGNGRYTFCGDWSFHSSVLMTRGKTHASEGCYARKNAARTRSPFTNRKYIF